MTPKDDFDTRFIEKKLRQLQEVPPRDVKKAAIGKASFLQAAESASKTVSPGKETRHMNKKEQLLSIFVAKPKEKKIMLSTLTSIILVLTLLFGGGTATVAAAQNSLPGDALYSIKLVSEEALLNVTGNPEAQFELTLNLLDRRVGEIQSLVESGQMITDEVQTRYRDQVNQAIMLALNLPEDKAVLALEKIQTRLLTEEQLFQQTQTQGSENAINELDRVREMLQERLQILQSGQGDLMQIQEQIQTQDQIQDQLEQSKPEATSTTVNGNSPISTNTDQGNPWTEFTPTPGSGFGASGVNSLQPTNDSAMEQYGNSDNTSNSYSGNGSPTSEPSTGNGQNGSH